MAKRSFSALEAFLIFLLVMMAAITVALLSLLFITSGTIENNKDSGNLDFSTSQSPPATQGPAATQSAPVTCTPELQNFSGYHIGVGRADCTGQVSDINLMGYAKSGQNARGILTRLYSRAFIVAEPNGSNRVVFVSIDIGMVSQRLRLEVLDRLQSKYGSLYRRDNVILSGTHTHSGPAGYFQYTVFVIASEGFSNRTFEYMVNGIMKSIEIAHTNMRPGKIFINKGIVDGAQINRSPYSYLQNPQSERARYSSNTDKEMVVLKMVDLNGDDLGLIRCRGQGLGPSSTAFPGCSRELDWKWSSRDSNQHSYGMSALQAVVLPTTPQHQPKEIFYSVSESELKQALEIFAPNAPITLEKNNYKTLN